MTRADEVFQKQLSVGIIEYIHDFEQYRREFPNFSFVSHFPLVKDDRQTTKVRIIYMANLAEKMRNGKSGVSINQCVHPGFCKNSRIATAFTLSRFDKYLLCYDIVKAFHNLHINEDNQSKFLFLWFKDVKKGDFTPVVSKFTRIIFGMSCSPYLLTCALHMFLNDNSNDFTLSESENKRLNEMKQLAYQGSYVDNISMGTNTLKELNYIHDNSVKVFEENKFPLQQFVTNHLEFQSVLDKKYNETTPTTVKILGMAWDRENDTVAAPLYKMKLEVGSKREVLKELNKNFDLMGTKLPLLNRSKLFLRDLQLDPKLGWDSKLSAERKYEWKKIAKQYNEYKPTEVPRCIGRRTDQYDMYIFADASKSFLGFCSYLKNIDSDKVSFLVANNRLLDRVDRSRSIPTLELFALEYSVQKGLEVYKEMTNSVAFPINISKIRLFSDNTVALSWINKSENMLDKMQKRTVVVNNRINHVVSMCKEIHTVEFSHIGTHFNSADFLTRELSPKRLANTSFITGPSILNTNLNEIDWIVIPNPRTNNDPVLARFALSVGTEMKQNFQVSKLIDLSRFSCLKKATKTMFFVKQFIANIKLKLVLKDSQKFSHFKITGDNNSYKECERVLLLVDQQKEFPELFEYFATKQNVINKIPPLVAQMNLVLDKNDGLIRVKNKLGKLIDNGIDKFPILLSKNSLFMKLIVLDFHLSFSHAGTYYILNQLRRRFFILKAYSSVKKIINSCIHCRRFNNRGIKVNANDYPSFMVNTGQKLFETVFIDYAGPYITKLGKERTKTYLVLFKCFFSKSINVQIVTSADIKGFLRAFQDHVYEYGLPQSVHSDAGSSINSGFSWLREILDGIEVKDYFDRCNVKQPTFEQYPRGSLNRGIPGFIESGIKMLKRFIYGAIKNNVIEFLQFSSIIKQAVCYANKRPLNSFSALRDQNINSSFKIITPEVLKLGYETCVVEINSPQKDIDEWSPHDSIDPRIAYKNVEQLVKIKNNIRNEYHAEFLYSLLDSAVHIKNKYLPVKHQVLEVNDTVLIKDPFVKPAQLPMGIITKIYKNSQNETTKVTVRKANRNSVTRDVSDIVLLLKNEIPDSFGASSSDGVSAGSDDPEEYSTKELRESLDRDLLHSHEICDTRKHRASAEKCNRLLAEYYK